MKKHCEFHEEYPASFICDSCGKSLCYYCQRNRGMPFQCPECMPAYWRTRVKRERIMCLTPIIVVIALMLSFMTYIILYDDYYDDPYSDIYVSEEDIIQIVHEETYSQATNEVDITFKIYVTNWGDKHSDEVFIELYLLKNSTVRYETTSSKAVVKAEETEIFELKTTIKLDYYDIQLKIWEGKMVVQEGRKQVQVNRGDIQDLTEFDGFYSGGSGLKEDSAEKSSTGFSEGSSILVILLIIGLPILLIGGFLFYKERTKMPNLGPPGGMPPAHGAFPAPPPFPPSPHAPPPMCPRCGSPVDPVTKHCAKCGKKV